jgi:hypothetical protein
MSSDTHHVVASGFAGTDSVTHCKDPLSWPKLAS